MAIMLASNKPPLLSPMFVDKVVRAYLNTVKGELMTSRELSELFRYCICRILDLDSQITPKFNELAKYVTNVLRGIDGWPTSLDESEKHACLESFVHVIELARGGVRC